MRYQQAAATAMEAGLGADADQLPATALAERLLLTMLDFGRERMGFTRIVLQASPNPHLTAAAAGMMEVATTHFAAVLTCRHPTLPAANSALVARVALTAVMALLGLLIAEKPRGEDYANALLHETHTLLAAYLLAYEARALQG
ncbi:MAG: hypothetical protein AB4911_24570 [Oscillochloridaceae bacterium umkhey_bin13]